MNYGEQFVEIYNNEFLKLKKDLIDYLEDNFNSDYTFTTIFDKFLIKLDNLQRDQYEKDNILMGCYEDFWFRYLTYSKNAAINIVNNNIFDRFSKNLELKSCKITDYNEFTNSLAKLCLYQDFEKVFRNSQNQIEAGFQNQDVSKIFKIKKQTNAEYLLSCFEKKNETLIKEIPKTDFKENVLINPFTKDEKILLMYYLLEYERFQDKKLSIYNLTLILKLSSGGFEDEMLVKKKDTLYEKINNGINHYALCNRKAKLKALLDKIKKFDLDAFEQYLIHQLHNL